MREILFRGKEVESGDWYYGDIFHSSVDVDTVRIHDYRNRANVKIIPETLGQFTGLTDKNGTKIFEGDIITFEDVCCEGGSGYEYPDEWAVETMNRVEVIICNGCVCFGKELFESNAYEDIQFYYPNLNEWFTECAEVIGNIYDNPELIGGGENGDFIADRR